MHKEIYVRRELKREPQGGGRGLYGIQHRGRHTQVQPSPHFHISRTNPQFVTLNFVQEVQQWLLPGSERKTKVLHIAGMCRTKFYVDDMKLCENNCLSSRLVEGKMKTMELCHFNQVIQLFRIRSFFIHFGKYSEYSETRNNLNKLKFWYLKSEGDATDAKPRSMSMSSIYAPGAAKVPSNF